MTNVEDTSSRHRLLAALGDLRKSWDITCTTHHELPNDRPIPGPRRENFDSSMEDKQAGAEDDRGLLQLTQV